jgi:hypothetical protein
MDVLRILFNLLLFTTALFAVALVVEKIEVVWVVWTGNRDL